MKILNYLPNPIRKLFSLVVVMTLVIATTVPLSSCNEDDRTKLMAASADFFDGLEAVSGLTETYNKSLQRVVNAEGKVELRQQLSDADALHIYQSLDRVGQGVSSFKKVLKDTPVITSNNKHQFLPLLDNITGELDKLNQQSVFFQSEGAKAKFDKGVKIASGAIKIIRTRIERIRSPVDTRTLPLGKFAN